MALVALIAVTVVWGFTFVQVKDAVDIYPLFAFLAVRYAIATGALGIAAVLGYAVLGALVSPPARSSARCSGSGSGCRRRG